jgi:EAL domain-containing protein (putative c-di-GMP-specific phosphodiesterase class I)
MISGFCTAALGAAYVMLLMILTMCILKLLKKRELAFSDTEEGLSQAMLRKELLLFYQPQFETQSGTLVGFEALLRWKHPLRGFIPPDKFIATAESSGLIVPIGEWVIREACRKNNEMHALGFRESIISVNISAVQLDDPFFPERVLRILKETGHPPDRLGLEITESAVMSSIETAKVSLLRLRNAGIHISLDDFGTGYSSLYYLQKLPLQHVKIDKCFIQEMDLEPKGRALLQSIISMTHQLGLGVVAEGIETEEQLRFLKSCGCECVQGYLFGKPLPEEEAKAFIGRALEFPVQAKLFHT